MADAVQFDLVSPERLVLSVEVDMVVVPGAEGDFGVLPGHAPLISNVRPGVISIYQNRVIEARVFVAGGFAEVSDSRLTVLTEDAVPLDEIDRAGAEARLAEARQALDDAGDDDRARPEAERRLAIAEALVAAVGQ
jgi:F-type H+-transporting ATPase subunit epsilon